MLVYFNFFFFAFSLTGFKFISIGSLFKWYIFINLGKGISYVEINLSASFFIIKPPSFVLYI